MADITIIATAITFDIAISGTVAIQYVTPVQAFAGTSLYYDCKSYDSAGNIEKGIVTFSFDISGELLSKYITASELDFGFVIAGTYYRGVTNGDTLDFGLVIDWDDTDLLLEKFKDSWVKWSQIGHADFNIGRDNIAGEMPMDWPGQIYEILKFKKSLMVYGENGVSQMVPFANAFGLTTIYHIGLKSRHAVVGNTNIHYFIDVLGQLWELGDGLNKLDYSEYLSAMTYPVMSWDNEKDLIYICDGTRGYVYSPDSRSLGKGPSNVCGVRYQNGTSYVVSPAAIEIPAFELTTDIYDFNTRKEKTILGIEISTELTGQMQASIEYRIKQQDSFTSLGWHNVNPDGRLNLPCYGVEFRFKLRNTEYEYFELDWLKVIGVIHGFSHLDIQG